MAQTILSRFRNTNDPPSELEAQQVRELSREVQENLSSVEAQICRLQDQQAALLQTIQFCDSILSPIRHVPPEILTHIFVLSLPSVWVAREVKWYDSLRGSPWALGQVSRHWRAVAMASPALWTSIIFKRTYEYAPNSALEFAPCSLPMLETQLLRSSNFPLHIVFDYQTVGFETDNIDSVAKRALEALDKCSFRWKSLYITGEQLARLPSLSGRIPLLEKLCVWKWESDEYGDADSPPPGITTIDGFQTAPRLRDVEIDHGYLIELPWGQLTRLKACAPWAWHVEALKRLSNVESCSLTATDGIGGPHQWQGSPVELPRLHQFKLNSYLSISADSNESFPQWLVLPALTELATHSACLRGLPDVLYVSKCTLKKLKLQAPDSQMDLVHSVLSSNPDITELLIDFGGPSAVNVKDMISLLTPDQSQPVLLPNIETFDFVWILYGHQNMLGDMLMSRWKEPASRLRSVTIGGMVPDVTKYMSSVIEQLRSEGLSVYVHNGYRNYQSYLRNYGDYTETF
ncbi:hypothetical protein B0H11DRAFT_1965208 [Mycena galericulata]|nr:hypothetical protein B0H11DRAFT_1965208 [Mycena galericulata]